MESLEQFPSIAVLRSVEFSTKRFAGGYDVDEVEEYLEKVAIEIEQMQAQMKQQDSRLRSAYERIQQLQQEPRTAASASSAPAPAPASVPAPAPAPVAAATPVVDVQKESGRAAEIIALAQEFVTSTRRNAETQAEQLIEEAKREATEKYNKIREEHKEEVDRLQAVKHRLTDEVDELRKRTSAERLRLRGLLADFMTWVDSALPSGSVTAPESTPVAPAAAVTPPPAAAPATNEPPTPPVTGRTIGEAVGLFPSTDDRDR